MYDIILASNGRPDESFSREFGIGDEISGFPFLARLCQPAILIYTKRYNRRGQIGRGMNLTKARRVLQYLAKLCWQLGRVRAAERLNANGREQTKDYTLHVFPFA